MDVNKYHENNNTVANKKINDNTFNVDNENELIKSEFESLLKNIESIIKEWFLKKEFYKNPSNGLNLEIANICNYSANDIEQRIKNGRGIFYMNPCLSQTLYFINKLKKTFPNLSKNANLCIEMLKLPELNIHNIHAYISISVPGDKPLIIDYARNNDVYIYQGHYSNRSSQKTEAEVTYTIPVYSFNENDNIFNITKKSGILGDKDINFNDMINNLVNKLTKDNSESNYQNWREKNQGLVIYNLLKDKG